MLDWKRNKLKEMSDECFFLLRSSSCLLLLTPLFYVLHYIVVMCRLAPDWGLFVPDTLHTVAPVELESW